MGSSVSASMKDSVQEFFTGTSPTTPDQEKESKFDPNYGFEAPRKARVMVATEAEMYSAKIPLHLRDYCAHHFINYRSCKKEKFPFLYRCHHERHAYLNCQYEDQIIRMKEHEREKRLLERKQRKEEKERKIAEREAAEAIH